MLQDKAIRDLFDAFETMDKYLLDVLPKSGCLASHVLGVADGGDMCDVCLLRQGARAKVGLVFGLGLGLGLGLGGNEKNACDNRGFLLKHLPFSYKHRSLTL